MLSVRLSGERQFRESPIAIEVIQPYSGAANAGVVLLNIRREETGKFRRRGKRKRFCPDGHRPPRYRNLRRAKFEDIQAELQKNAACLKSIF